MKHALISGQIYRNEDGSTDIETFTRIDNDNGITDIFDDVEHTLLEQIVPNFDNGEIYFFIAFVESKFVAYTNWEGTEYEVEHDVTEIKNFKDLPQGIESNELHSVAEAVEEMEKLQRDKNDWEDEYMKLKRRFEELDTSALESLELLNAPNPEIESLKAITELKIIELSVISGKLDLAVKGLKEIESSQFVISSIALIIARATLREIEVLQHAQT